MVNRVGVLGIYSVSDLQQLAKVNPTESKLEFQSSIHERNENVHDKTERVQSTSCEIT